MKCSRRVPIAFPARKPHSPDRRFSVAGSGRVLLQLLFLQTLTFFLSSFCAVASVTETDGCILRHFLFHVKHLPVGSCALSEKSACFLTFRSDVLTQKWNWRWWGPWNGHFIWPGLSFDERCWSPSTTVQEILRFASKCCRSDRLDRNGTLQEECTVPPERGTSFLLEWADERAQLCLRNREESQEAFISLSPSVCVLLHTHAHTLTICYFSIT